jgi:hypothetical protein
MHCERKKLQSVNYRYLYDIQHLFICPPSDSILSENAGIELRTAALVVRRSNSQLDLGSFQRKNISLLITGLLIRMTLMRIWIQIPLFT